jgi:hypothetical protein
LSGAVTLYLLIGVIQKLQFLNNSYRLAFSFIPEKVPVWFFQRPLDGAHHDNDGRHYHRDNDDNHSHSSMNHNSFFIPAGQPRYNVPSLPGSQEHRALRSIPFLSGRLFLELLVLP